MDKEREEGRRVRGEAEEPLLGRQEPRGVRHPADFAKRTRVFSSFGSLKFLFLFLRSATIASFIPRVEEEPFLTKFYAAVH